MGAVSLNGGEGLHECVEGNSAASDGAIYGALIRFISSNGTAGHRHIRP